MSNTFLFSVPGSNKSQGLICLALYSRAVSWGVVPVALSAHGLGRGGPERWGPQNSQTTHACDQYQRGGQTQEKRIQGRHRVDLLHPLVEGMRLKGCTPSSLVAEVCAARPIAALPAGNVGSHHSCQGHHLLSPRVVTKYP
jgi:hypothetical protein